MVETVVSPGDVGLAESPPGSLRGGDADHNAQVVRDVVAGQQGPVRDAVVLNAAAGLVVHAGEGGDPVTALTAARERAEEAIDSGRAATLLERWAAATTA